MSLCSALVLHNVLISCLALAVVLPFDPRNWYNVQCDLFSFRAIVSPLQAVRQQYRSNNYQEDRQKQILVFEKDKIYQLMTQN